MKRYLIAGAIMASLALPSHAANIVDEWASVKPPAAPALKPVTVDPKTTALLMLDFMNQNCGATAALAAGRRTVDRALALGHRQRAYARVRGLASAADFPI